MNNFFQWFDKRPHTKAAWVAAFCGIASIIIFAFQTIILTKQSELLKKQTAISEEQLLILKKQTKISEEQTILSREQTSISATQTAISEKQTQLLSRQIETSIKPYVEIKLENGNNGIEKLIVLNKGNYSVKNIQIIPVYFAHIQQHGWYASIGSNPVFSKDLYPGKNGIWTLHFCLIFIRSLL